MDFYKFWQIIEGERWNMEPGNRADFEYHYGGPGDDAPDTGVHGDEEFERKLVYANGVFKDYETDRVVPVAGGERIAGGAEDGYTLRFRLILSGKLYARNDDWELDHNTVTYEVDGCHLSNDGTNRGFEVPNPEGLFRLEGERKSAAYEIRYDQSRDGISFSIH